ncbi:LPS translocon maturation chaperone LptM [Paraferrimonas sedimenticola]|uniref:LPS translocon maturation chaperone LptM n=1 Tax=Paraferrimonas sedimenticola TaxID=375674 RepID=UPI001FE5AFBA|nr:lipoprotein [Paraferrimonas sedimenticola]
MRTLSIFFLCLLLSLGGLSGCGQKGPLYKADPEQTNQPPAQTTSAESESSASNQQE